MRRVLIPGGVGFLGMLLGLLLWHAYTDHVAFHQLAEYLNRVAPKINQLQD